MPTDADVPPVRIDVNLTLGPWLSDAHESWTVQDVERHLDRFGVAAGLVRSSLAVTYDAAAGNQRLLDEITGHPRLLPAFVLGPLGAGEHGPADQVPGQLHAAGIRGIWLLPGRHGWSISGMEARSLLDALRQAGLPVLVELDDAGWPAIEALCRAIPDTDVIATRVGYRTLRQLFPMMEHNPHLSVDLSYTAATDGLELLVDRFGSGRVLMGTGAPICDPAAPWFVLQRSTLGPADRAAVAGGTACRLLEVSDPLPVSATETFNWSGEILDAHAHIGRWPSSWLPNPGTEALLAAHARTGTTHAVISHLGAIFGGDAPAANAAAIAAAATHPERLSAYVVANPNRPEDGELLRNQLRLPHVRGLKVHPDTHDCPIDDRRLEWVWELAVAEDVPVLAHGFGGTAHSDPYLFGRVADRHDNLTLIVGHSGATVEGFRRTIEVARTHQNLLAETCGSWMTGRWLRRLVDALGAERVLHGTDACLIDPRYGVGRVLGSGLGPSELKLVLAGNARRVLRIPPHPQPVGGPPCS